MCYDIKEVTAAVEKVVFFYNTEHLTIDGTSGGVTHTGEIKKGWTSYRDIAIKNLQPKNIITIR